MASEKEGAVEEAPSVGAQIFTLGLPMLIGALSSSMSGIADTAMIGHYGTAELAAVSGAAAMFDILAGIVLASFTGHQILAARFAGREDPAGIRRSLTSSAWFCGGIAVLLTLLCTVAGEWLTGFAVGGDARLQAIGADYLTARAPTLLLLVPFSLLAAVFNAYRKPRYAMVAGIVINAVNLVLDWLLIYGTGVFPELGATGNGLATTLSWLVGVVLLAVSARHFGLSDLLRRPDIGKPVDFATSVPRLSWPAILSTGLDYASLAVFFAIIGRLGESELAGGRIAFEIIIFLFAVGSAFGAAVRILVGRATGAGRISEVWSVWRVGRVVLLVPALVISLLLVVFPTAVTRLFTSFEPVIDATAQALPLVALCIPLMAWTLGNLSILRALGKTDHDMYSNLATALFVQLPLAWLLTDVMELGITGAYVAVASYWLARLVLTEMFAHMSVRAESRKAAAAADDAAAADNADNRV
ncbi:MATE family efflux transporter [Planomonospora algeriensis]